MINNRQGGRRRGRGGGGPRPNNAPSGGGNRQDTRQRGNAAQLLEKYRQLARDSQLQGDRVQTENYHQYAEHYFRLLNENRARFEEQRPRHRDDEYDDGDEGEEEISAAESDGDEQGQADDFDYRRDRPQRRDHREGGDGREQRQARPPREAREPREQREAREPREVREPREAREPRPVQAGPEQGQGDQRNSEVRDAEGSAPRRRRGRRDFSGEDRADDGGEARIALDSLPPAIGADIVSIDEAEAGRGDDPPPPRRRTRRPRVEEGDPAPAAA